MNCKYMNMLRVVRGNAFKLKIAVEAYTPSSRRIDSFALGEAVLKLDKNGTLTTKEYTILEGTTILVAFDGSESLGVYGFQMSGEYEGEAWRWANAEIFQIVESNVKAHIPEGCVLLDDTYNMALKIVLSGGDGVTFTPSVSEQGIISWTNDGGLPNPEPRNIRGPRGEQGPQGEVGPQGPRGQMGLRGQIGPKGDKGDKGDTGATPVLDVTASVDENVGNPMVVVESFGPAEHRTFDFQFKNLKGQKGETGATGPQGPQGQQGEPGNYTKPASGIPLSDLNGNVASGIVYDVTANNSGATFASLSALLSSGSLSTLIPTDVRKGGMQIRFVCSSDNKYVQYRHMGTATTGSPNPFLDTANWQGVDSEPVAGSKNLVESAGVYKKLSGIDNYTVGGYINQDGYTITSNGDYAYSDYFDVTPGTIVRFNKGGNTGTGVYALLYKEDNSTDYWTISASSSYRDVSVPSGFTRARFSFLKTAPANASVGGTIIWEKTHTNGIEDDIENLENELENKTDKVDGKSLIDAEYAASQSVVDNPEWIDVKIDNEGNVLEGIKTNGEKVFGVIPQQIVEYVNQEIADYGLTFDVTGNQETYNFVAGSSVNTVSNPLQLPLRKGNKLRFKTEGNSMSLYPNGEPLILYLVCSATKRIRFAQVHDAVWHECEIPTDAIGVGLYTLTNLIQDATITLYIEECSGKRYEHDKVYTHNGQFDLLPNIPSYYFENGYLDSKIDTINAAISSCSTNCDVFFWITDVHWENCYNAGYSPSLIKYITDRTSISRVLGGGDYMNGPSYDSFRVYDFMNKMRLAIGSDKFYTAYGNHDFINHNTYNEVFYGLRQRLDDVVYGDSDKTYFYFDDTITKTRYIALASFGYRDPDTLQYTSLYNSAQLSWFTGTALNVETGWTIIIFTHSLYALTGEDYHLTVISLSGAQDFINAIDNYNGNGTIACVLIGHTHVDRIHQNTNGVPYIISACDRYDQYVLNGGYELILPKALGTKDEQHFEVVVVDHQNRNIKLIAIGSPSLDGREDNVGDETEIREVDY